MAAADVSFFLTSSANSLEMHHSHQEPTEVESKWVFFRRHGLERTWARGFAYDDSCEIQNFLPLKQTLCIDLANGPAELS